MYACTNQQPPQRGGAVPDPVWFELLGLHGVPPCPNLRKGLSTNNNNNTHLVICLGATDFALPAAISCSLTKGVQKLEIFTCTEKFGLVILTILVAAKNFVMSLRNKNFKAFVKQLNHSKNCSRRCCSCNPFSTPSLFVM